MIINKQINRILIKLFTVLFATCQRCSYVSAATSVAPGTTSTADPPTTTGTVFTDLPTQASDEVKFTDPIVYGPVAGGAVLLAVGAVVLALVIKKGLLSGAAGASSAGAGAGAMFGGKGVAPQSTALVQQTGKSKISRTKVRPMKVKIQTLNERKPSLSIIRIQKTTLSFHNLPSAPGSKL